MSYIVGMKIKTGLVVLALAASSLVAGDKEDLADFVGGVYRKPGAYSLTRNAALSANGSVWKNGDNYFTPEGCYRKVGNAYFRPDGESVWFTGSTYIAPEGGVAKSGNAIYGSTSTAISTGNSVTVIGDGEEEAEDEEQGGFIKVYYTKPLLPGYVVLEPHLAGYEVLEPERPKAKPSAGWKSR